MGEAQRQRLEELRDYLYNWNAGEMENARIEGVVAVDQLIVLLGETDQVGTPAWASAIAARDLFTKLLPALDQLDKDLAQRIRKKPTRQASA